MASKSRTAPRNHNFQETGITDASGNPYFKSTILTPGLVNPLSGGYGGGGGDGTIPLWKPDTARDLQLIKLSGSLLIAAFGVSFMFFLNRIDGVGANLGTAQIGIARLEATATGNANTLLRIESKLEAQSTSKLKTVQKSRKT